MSQRPLYPEPLTWSFSFYNESWELRMSQLGALEAERFSHSNHSVWRLTTDEMQVWTAAKNIPPEFPDQLITNYILFERWTELAAEITARGTPGLSHSE